MKMRRSLEAGMVAAMLAILPGYPAASAEETLTLTDAVRQALSASLDLAAQREALEADREQIGITRSALLPQIGVGAQGQILDDDRADGIRGDVTKKSATLTAGLSQVLYDDDAWAGYSIQKHLYESQKSQFESTRLDAIADAAKAFFELARGEALVRIQKQNREITRQNIETANARVATGYSGERDVLRWQSQLSANDTAVVQAQTLALVSRFELNRVRNLPRESAVEIVRATVDEYGFVYARESIAAAALDEKGGRVLRDFMVRLGLARSPLLSAIDAEVAAEQRQVTAGHRAFWVPTVSFGAGVNYLAAQQSANNGNSNSNVTEWGVKAGLSIPLLEGGARFSELSQSQRTLSSLRTQRRAEGQSIDEGIRKAFAQSSQSYASLGFARSQEASSKRNFELVNESYVAGVSSILDLLDAQTQHLDAQISVANAYFGFLEDLMTAEQQISYFAFLEEPADTERLVDQLEAHLQSPPTR